MVTTWDIASGMTTRSWYECETLFFCEKVKEPQEKTQHKADLKEPPTNEYDYVIANIVKPQEEAPKDAE